MLEAVSTEDFLMYPEWVSLLLPCSCCVPRPARSMGDQPKDLDLGVWHGLADCGGFTVLDH